MSEQVTDAVKVKKSIRPGYLEVVIIALMVVSAAVYGYDRILAQKVMVVDLKGYIRTQEALLRAGEITEEQLQAGFDKVDETLSQKAAANKNHVFLLKEVVLENGNEISIN